MKYYTALPQRVGVFHTRDCDIIWVPKENEKELLSVLKGEHNKPEPEFRGN